jgi:N-hydroxyarylamine O-acetyltransferase
MPTVDLDAYLARIGYDGPRAPTLDVLRAIHVMHPAAIPFEAIDVQLGHGVDLAPEAIDAKLITRRRGGYCFEQNSLLKRALTALGFQVEALIGRVWWMAPEGAPPRPRTHMALKVMAEGRPWLADVGFGGLVLTTPLAFDGREAQPTGHEDFRLVEHDGELLVEARLGKHWQGIGDGWSRLYELSTEPQLDVDFETANWFTSTHPASHFRHALRAARTTPEARYALLNNRLTVRRRGGVEQSTLSVQEIETVLSETFGLRVEPDWRPLLDKAVTEGAT